MVKGMAAQHALAPVQLLAAQRHQSRLQLYRARQQIPERVPAAILQRDRCHQQQHAAAFGPDRLAGGDVGGHAVACTRGAGQRVGMQFRVAAGQPEGIACWQWFIGQRAEEVQLGTQGL